MSSSKPDNIGAVAAVQNAGYGVGYDYNKGSPHLRHSQLRSMVQQRLTRLVRARIDAVGSCSVLEIGAGDGTFTSCMIAAGAYITATEASEASADHIRERFAGSEQVEVMFDETGERVFATNREWDLAVMTSVLHHVPDYLGFLDRLCRLLAAGGGIFTAQDPLYYPRMSAIVHRADRAAFLSWRVLQGNYVQGIKTQLRRLRGVYDDNEPGDVLEYHIVREGLNEEAIKSLLSPRFESFEMFRYWSSQAPLWQWLGERAGFETTFGIEATGYIE